jgi:aryl-alcohol dehydrogenase-like predicted oxidoreductase
VPVEESMGAMAQLQAEGKVRMLGVPKSIPHLQLNTAAAALRLSAEELCRLDTTGGT